MRANPKVSIVILNYNSWDLTFACLKSLEKQSYENIEIILVDNGSEEEFRIHNYEFRIKNFRIVYNGENLGFAQGNNVGYKASSFASDLILFLNNDTIVDKNFLLPLVRKLTSDPKIAGVQPKILNYPQKKIIDSVGSYFINSGFLYHFGHNKKDQNKYNKQQEIFSMKGACMLFKRKVLEKTGVFDKDYFAYFEETDLCLRIHVAGYKIFYVPKSRIYHLGGGTARKLVSSFIQYHSYKNRIYTYLKNFELNTLLKILPIHVLLCEFVAFSYLARFQIDLFVSIQKAFFWNIVNYKKILSARKKIKRLRKVQDFQFLPKLTRSVRISYYYHLLATSLAGYKD